MPQFNRVPSAIKQMMVQLLGLPCVSYFDDFPSTLPDSVALVVGRERGWEEPRTILHNPKFLAPVAMFDIEHALIESRLEVTYREEWVSGS